MAIDIAAEQILKARSTNATARPRSAAAPSASGLPSARATEFSATTSAAAAPAAQTATPRRGPGDLQAARWVAEYVSLRSREAEDPSTLARLGALKARIAGHYAGLVESIARRFLNSGEPFDDLVQEGFLGLLSALENYDPGKNVKFSTYATHFVAGSIRHFLRDRGKIIKEPAWLHELCVRMNRVIDGMTQSLGRTPDTGEIARTMNLTEEAVEEILSTRRVFQVAAIGGATSSDAGGDESEMAGVIDPEKIRSDKYVTLQLPIEDRIVLEHAVDRLKVLEQKVLFEFFYKDLSQTEIARQMGISCNYVSHILKNSTKKLRRIIGEADVTDRGRDTEAQVMDAASGLFTAEHLLARVDEELSRAARAGQTAALLYIELNGLPVGRTGEARLRREHVWSACASMLQRTLRRIDIAGRFEDDNLVAFLPDIRPEAAAKMVSRLENLLLAAEALIGEAITIQVTSALYPAQGRNTFDLIGEARQQALSERLSRDETARHAVAE
jgi:RNA polymerase sigma-B factor